MGQVYARHLQLGGAEVTFFVKDKYAESARAGFVLYPLNRPKRRRTEPVRLDGVPAITTIARAAAEPWDVVILTVASPALRQGTWLAELGRATGDATIVVLQPGFEDHAIVTGQAAIDERRLVFGAIVLLSYAAPLPGETRFASPGTAYWFLPLISAPLSGPAARVGPLVDVLRRGGLPVRRDSNIARITTFPTAVLMPHLTALETVGWRWDALRAEPLRLALRASAEASAIATHARGLPLPFVRRLLKPFVIRAGLCLVPLVVPLDIETFWREHFTKVSDQTRLFMNDYLARGRAAGQPTAALEELMRRAGWPPPSATAS